MRPTPLRAPPHGSPAAVPSAGPALDPSAAYTLPQAVGAEFDEAGRLLGHFETMHASGHEPWAFSDRGVERLRHERIAELVRTFAPGAVLDVGCSLGQLTVRLAALPVALTAVDLSPSAVRRARAAVLAAPDRRARSVHVATGSATGLPFEAGRFDVAVASDGLHSWHLDAASRAAALRELHRVLAPGGHAVLTEYLRPEEFAEFVAEVAASPLRVERVIYMGDRPCYQFEGWLRAVRHWPPARALRRSVTLARVLCAVGARVGARASRHVCVVAVHD